MNQFYSLRDEFAPFKIRWEFSKLVDLPVPKLLDNFMRALCKVNDHIFQLPEFTKMDQLSLELLQRIPMVFKAGKKQWKDF